MCFGIIGQPFCRNAEMKAPNGCFSMKRTVCGSIALISLQRSYMPRHRACVSGSILVVLNTTSSAVKLLAVVPGHVRLQVERIDQAVRRDGPGLCQAPATASGRSCSAAIPGRSCRHQQGRQKLVEREDQSWGFGIDDAAERAATLRCLGCRAAAQCCRQTRRQNTAS